MTVGRRFLQLVYRLMDSVSGSIRFFPLSVWGRGSEGYSSMGGGEALLLGISLGASKREAENTSSLPKGLGSKSACSLVSTCSSGGRGRLSVSSFCKRRCLFRACPEGTTTVAVFFLSRGLIGLVKCLPGPQDVAGSFAREGSILGIRKTGYGIAFPQQSSGTMRQRLSARRSLIR
jgi:hypothetical protein